jgi:hypothetical protein
MLVQVATRPMAVTGSIDSSYSTCFYACTRRKRASEAER